jgi:hypothetical protein
MPKWDAPRGILVVNNYLNRVIAKTDSESTVGLNSNAVFNEAVSEYV